MFRRTGEEAKRGALHAFPSRWLATLALALVWAGATAERAAAVPDPTHSTIPASVTLGAGCCSDVIVRDYSGFPIAGSTVTIDFQGCPIAFCAAQPTGTTVDPDLMKATVTTDANGVAHVCVCASLTGTCTANLYADGIPLGSRTVQGCDAWGADGDSVVTRPQDQLDLAIVSDGAGGAILAWEDYRSGTSDIYARHVLSSGATDPAWGPMGIVVCAAASDQRFPVIVSDHAGGAIIAWDDFRNGNHDVYAQRVLANGTTSWASDGVALCTAAGNQVDPVIAEDGAGGAIVAWDDFRAGNHDIYAQHVTSAGAIDALWPVNGRALSTASGDQQFSFGVAAITSDGAGGAIVTWQDSRSGNFDVYAQRVSNSGSIDWTLNGVPVCTASGSQSAPTITTDGGNGAIVAWLDKRSSSTDVYAQHVDANGAATWLSNGLAVSTATGDQLGVRIASDGIGGAIVTWTDLRVGAASDIYAARALANGSLDSRWPANGQVLCAAAGEQANPCIVSDGSQGAIVAWIDRRSSSDADVYAQHVTGSGIVDPGWTADGSPLCTATGAQAFPSIASDGAGGAIVAWHDLRNTIDYDVYAEHVTGTIFFEGAAHEAVGGATVTRTADDTLLVSGLGSSGGDGLQVVLPDGISEFRTQFVMADQATIPVGAYLEVSSRLASSPGDSLGFTRMTKLAGPDEYEITSNITGEPQKVIAVYSGGVRVYSDLRPASVAQSDVHAPHGLSTNDDLGSHGFAPTSSGQADAHVPHGTYMNDDLGGHAFAPTSSGQADAHVPHGTYVNDHLGGRAFAPTSSAQADAHVPHGTYLNDDLGSRALAPASTGPLSPLFLRWQWADTTGLTIVNRPNGAPDTVVTGDELRIEEANPAGGNYESLGQFFIRGKDLGQIQIVAETNRNTGVRPAGPSRGGAVSFAAPTPNPSRGAPVVLSFRLPAAMRVAFEVLDLAGRRVESRAPQICPAGANTLRWQPHTARAGLYFIRLVTDSGATAVRRWIVLQ